MRDDFPTLVKDILAKRVAMRCSNPGCRKPTSGPRDNPLQVVNIGVASHITAASPGGPRYDNSISNADRSCVTNGIWLCQNCAKLVDNDETLYTTAKLRVWKSDAEAAARRDIESNASSLIDVRGICIENEKLNTYLEMGRIFFQLEENITIMQNWTNKIMSDDEIAESSVHVTVSELIERLRTGFTLIKQLRTEKCWLLAWKIDALLYAISHKGNEMLGAVECYENEKIDWQMKRGHLLNASGTASVILTFYSMCSDEAYADMSQISSNLNKIPNDQEQKAFFKILGNMGRSQSKNFSDENPELVERLREAIQLANENNNRVLKYKLRCDAMLAPTRKGSLNLNHQQKIEFLIQLYDECLGFYFRMWNESMDEESERKEQLRLDKLLHKQSTKDIQDAFRDMINAIKKTFTDEKPLAVHQLDYQGDFEKKYLATLRPSASKYDQLQRLTELHLVELKMKS